MLCDIFDMMTSYNTTPCGGERMQALMGRLAGSDDMQDVSEMFTMILSKLEGEGVDFYPMFSAPGISLATPLTHLLSVDMTKGPTSLHQQLSSARFCAGSRLWPKCLVIELTRLVHDRPAEKSRHQFHFPTSFDTRKYGPALSQPPVYTLHAVVVHGVQHFWSYVVKNGSLWKCNDAVVSEVHPQPIGNAIAQGRNATVSMICPPPACPHCRTPLTETSLHSQYRTGWFLAARRVRADRREHSQRRTGRAGLAFAVVRGRPRAAGRQTARAVDGAPERQKRERHEIRSAFPAVRPTDAAAVRGDDRRVGGHGISAAASSLCRVS